MTYKRIPQDIPHWWMVWFWEANFHWNMETGCLEYNNPKKIGYPRVNLGSETFAAHRIAYFLYYDADPLEMLVRHLCHNHNCANPMHLTLGTHWDNSQDMVNAGRSQKGEKHWTRRMPERLEQLKKHASKLGTERTANFNGEKHPTTKLTPEKVRAIKAHSKMGATNKDLAAAFGVTHSNISAIVLGKSWKHIKVEGREKDDRWQPKYTDDQIRDIRQRYDSGERIIDISRALDIPDSTVDAIAKRIAHPNVE